MERSRIALIIPAYNEAETIFDVVNEAKKYGQPIVVDDNSTDQTAQIALRAGAIVVNHEINLGYDCSLNTGFAESERLNFEYIITLDADGQHDPALLPYIVKELIFGTPLVLGVRSSKARIAESIFALYTRLRFGVLDPLCGLKGYSRDAYLKVGYFDSYSSIGTELMLRTVSSGRNFKQIEFTAKNRVDKPRFGRNIVANLMIMRSLFCWIFS